jgi:hypothetical protein
MGKVLDLKVKDECEATLFVIDLEVNNDCELTYPGGETDAL